MLDLHGLQVATLVQEGHASRKRKREDLCAGKGWTGFREEGIDDLLQEIGSSLDDQSR